MFLPMLKSTETQQKTISTKMFVILHYFELD